jgi:hypothetical protein
MNKFRGPSGKTYLPLFIKIPLSRNDCYTKRKEGVLDKVLLRNVSTDVLGTPNISTELFHPMKRPELLTTLTQKRGTETHHLSHYAGADLQTSLSCMGPACRQERPTLPHVCAFALKHKTRTLNFSPTERKRTEL